MKIEEFNSIWDEISSSNPPSDSDVKSKIEDALSNGASKEVQEFLDEIASTEDLSKTLALV